MMAQIYVCAAHSFDEKSCRSFWELPDVTDTTGAACDALAVVGLRTAQLITTGCLVFSRESCEWQKGADGQPGEASAWRE